MDLLDDIVPILIEDSIDSSDPDYCPHPAVIVMPRKRAGKKAITLPRDVLLSITSAKFDAFAASFHSLTLAERNEIQRQRRLVNNRESAAASRKRKATAYITLEEENKVLRHKLEVAKGKLEFLQSIKQEVFTL